MSTSLKAQVQQALADRLATITTANGYGHTIKKIFVDKIPMGIQLSPGSLPAILLLDEGASYTHEQRAVEVAHRFRFQIIAKKGESDATMFELERAIKKAIYANSPTAARTDGFRSMHSKIIWVELLNDASDLHMIEANRIATNRMVVHYRSKPYDL